MDHQPQPATKAEVLANRRRIVAMYERLTGRPSGAAATPADVEPAPGRTLTEYECPEHYQCKGDCDPEALF